MEQIKYGFGIDMAKDKFDCCLSTIATDQQVMVKNRCTFPNTPAGFDAFLKWSQKNMPLDIPSVFLMEATGIYYEQLAWYLHEKDRSVWVVLPNKAKKYKDALGLKSKTDRIDAQALSCMCCQQIHTPWKPISKNIYALRMVTRQIESLGDMITSVSNRLQALQHGMYRSKDVENMLQKQLDLFEKQKAALHQSVEQIVAKDPVLKRKFDQICLIKGLGLQTLAVIVAETNGFAAFESAAQLVSYSGYDVVENQSNKRVGKTRISKKGNSHIRRAMHFAAFNVVRYRVGGFEAFYTRIYERSKLKMKAYTAVQKKLLTIVYALWKKDQAFDPQYRWAESKQKTTVDKEPVPSLAAAPAADAGTTDVEAAAAFCQKEITPSNTDGVTQDRQPSTTRRLPSLATLKLAT
jgi:transposase